MPDTEYSDTLDLFAAFSRGRLDPTLWRHRFRKVPFSPSTRKHENGVFKDFHSEERLRKVVFSVTVFTGYVWTEGQFVKKKSRFQTKTDPSGRVLKLSCKVSFFLKALCTNFISWCYLSKKKTQQKSSLAFQFFSSVCLIQQLYRQQSA